MKRPGRAYLVVIAEQAEAVFADRDEARDYTEPHGDWAQIQQIPWWPAGVWRYGIATSAGGTIGRAASIPTDVLDAQQRHAQANRRCTGAGIEKLTGPHGQSRYHCPRCQDRIY
jgi:hypothetical protein